MPAERTMRGRTAYYKTESGEWMDVRHACKYCGCSTSSLRLRLKRGYSLEEIRAYYNRKPAIIPSCLHCGKDLQGVPGKRYCSYQCKKAARPKVNRNCELCGKPFRTSTPIKRFCGKKCQYQYTGNVNGAQSETIRELKSTILRHRHCMKYQTQKQGGRLLVCTKYSNWLKEDTKFCCAESKSKCSGYIPDAPLVKINKDVLSINIIAA